LQPHVCVPVFQSAHQDNIGRYASAFVRSANHSKRKKLITKRKDENGGFKTSPAAARSSFQKQKFSLLKLMVILMSPIYPPAASQRLMDYLPLWTLRYFRNITGTLKEVINGPNGKKAA
jgi:hypothetical protein